MSSKKSFLLFALFTLAGCAGSVESRGVKTTSDYQPAAVGSPSDVRIYHNKPSRPYKEIGTVEASGVAANLYLKDALREEAAAMGAEAVVGLGIDTHVSDGPCMLETVPVAKGTAISYTAAGSAPVTAKDPLLVSILTRLPERPYEERGVVEVRGLSTKMDIKQSLKEQAASLGADAVIDFRVETEAEEGSCITETIPTIKGTAIVFLPPGKSSHEDIP